MKIYWANKWAKYIEQPVLRKTKRVLSRGNTLKAPKCCLGHAEFMVGNKFIQRGNIWYVENTLNSMLLSPKTVYKFGMNDSSGSGTFNTPVFYKNKNYYSLADLNDAGMSLKKIAKVVRERKVEL